MSPLLHHAAATRHRLYSSLSHNPNLECFFGGNGGRKPRIADQIGVNLTLFESLDLVRRALTVYQREAEDRMRTADYLRSVVLENFLKKIEKDASIDSGQRI